MRVKVGMPCAQFLSIDWILRSMTAKLPTLRRMCSSWVGGSTLRAFCHSRFHSWWTSVCPPVICQLVFVLMDCISLSQIFFWSQSSILNFLVSDLRRGCQSFFDWFLRIRHLSISKANIFSNATCSDRQIFSYTHKSYRAKTYGFCLSLYSF